MRGHWLGQRVEKRSLRQRFSHVERMRQQRFSLIELLVSVAIIAVLISLLNPALRGMVENGRRVQCSSNLKHLYSGSMYHKEDWQTLPPSSGMAGWWWWLGWSNAEGKYWGSDFAKDYLDDKQDVFVCPSADYANCPWDPYSNTWPTSERSYYNWFGNQWMSGFSRESLVSPWKFATDAERVVHDAIQANGQFWTMRPISRFEPSPDDLLWGDRTAIYTKTPEEHNMAVDPRGGTNHGQSLLEGGSFLFYDGSVRWHGIEDLGEETGPYLQRVKLPKSVYPSAL